MSIKMLFLPAFQFFNESDYNSIVIRQIDRAFIGAGNRRNLKIYHFGIYHLTDAKR